MNRNWMKHVHSLDIKYTVALVQSHQKVRLAKALRLLLLSLLAKSVMQVEIVKMMRFVISKDLVRCVIIKAGVKMDWEKENVIMHGWFKS